MFGKAFTRAITLATVASLLLTSVAYADTLLADSDVLTSGNETNVFLDSATGGLTQAFNVALAIQCASNRFHIEGNTTVGMDAGSTIPSGGSLSATAVVITRPATWPADGTDCPSPAPKTTPINSLVTVTAPAATTSDQQYTFTLRWNVSDSDVKQVSGADVSIKFTVRATGGGGTTPPANNPPSVHAGADVNGSEGLPISLDANVTDDDAVTTAWTYAIVNADPGATCSFADASAVDTTIMCTDDGQFTATLTANDGINAAVSHSATVTVSNADPAPDAGADQNVNEGDLVALSGTSTDPGTNDAVASQSWSVTDPSNNVVASGTLATLSFRPGDNGTYTATYTVTDDDGGSAGDSADISVSNVAPTTSNAAFAADATTAFKFNATFDYSDAGWLDTHSGSAITWTINGLSYAATSTVTALGDTGSPAFETGSVSSSITLAPGCYTIAASGTALDDDGGSTPVSFTTGYETTPLDVPTVSFLAPIKDNERNFAKYGNVLPVKVSLASSCNPGTQISTASLYLSYIQGTSNETIVGDEVITTSVSTADSGNVMRFNDSFYIYNFSTKPLSVGKDYTLRVRYGSSTGPLILTAVLQPKK